MKGGDNAKAICSRTGRACRCESGAGCVQRGKRSTLDTVPSASLSWARTAMLRLTDAAEALDVAIDGLHFRRSAPAPEWRDKIRRINRLVRELEEETK